VANLSIVRSEMLRIDNPVRHIHSDMQIDLYVRRCVMESPVLTIGLK